MKTSNLDEITIILQKTDLIQISREEIIQWQEIEPYLRTSEIIREFIKTGTFTDEGFIEKIKPWMQHLITLEEAFCGMNAKQNWSNLCEILLIKVCGDEQNQGIYKAVMEGSENGHYEFEEINVILGNFSSLLWLLGLADTPIPFFSENSDKKNLRVHLRDQNIYHGQIVLNGVHKNQASRGITNIINDADTVNLANMKSSSGTIDQSIG